MKKKTSHAFGKDCYLLGADNSGQYYWLEESKFACGWYWGIGYVESYTNNKNPNLAKDICSHTHFDSLFAGHNKSMYDNFKELLTDRTVTDAELWTLCELMKTLYTMREYADTCHRGGSHYTNNPQSELIKSLDGDRVNKEVIPALLQEVYNLLK